MIDIRVTDRRERERVREIHTTKMIRAMMRNVGVGLTVPTRINRLGYLR